MSAESIQKNFLSEGIPEHVDELEPFLRSKPMWIEMSAANYHAGPGVGSSMLKTATMKSMAHYRAGYIDEDTVKEESEAMKMGRLCHLAILEGRRYRERFVIEPEFWGVTTKGEKTNSKNAKDVKEKYAAWYSDLPKDAVVVTQEKQEQIIGMIEAVLAHPIAAGLLTGGRAETPGYAVCPETGLLMKILPDFRRDDGIIVDYKTTKDASPFWWPRQAAKLGFHIQAGQYRRVANIIENTPKENRFAFIAQEKVKPYAVTVHVADAAFLERGEQIAMHAARKIAACMKENFWPGYSEAALSLSLPEWALRDEEEVLL